MYFSVGVETPKDENTAYGIVVPVFSTYDYGCFSAADSHEEIAANAREAILAMLDEVALDGRHSVSDMKDAGFMVYQASSEYSEFDKWFVIDVDVSKFEDSRSSRVNVTLPDVLLSRIDNCVKANSKEYKNRSHFLAVASRNELSHKN